MYLAKKCQLGKRGSLKENKLPKFIAFFFFQTWREGGKQQNTRLLTNKITHSMTRKLRIGK